MSGLDEKAFTQARAAYAQGMNVPHEKCLEASIRAYLASVSPALPEEVRGLVGYVTKTAIEEFDMADTEIREVFLYPKGTLRPENEVALYTADALTALAKERDEARAKLFPYADATEISGMSWNGFYLIGDEKSIKELRRLENRSSQIDVFRAAFDERIAAAEAKLAEARKVIEQTEQQRAEQWRMRREAEADRDTEKAIAATLRARLETVEAETRERLSNELDPEIGLPSDARLRNIHADLEMRGRKHSDFAVTVHHRNIVLSAVAAAIRNLEPRHD